MNRKALLALALVVILPALSYVLVKYYSATAVVIPPRFFADTVLTKVKDGKETTDTVWHAVKDLTLTNQLGNKVRLNDLQDKVLVVDFFFTRCPTICPKLTANMRKLQDALKTRNDKTGEDPAFIHFLSLSVDPERDSAAALKKYGDRFGVNPDKWWLLTGPKDSIYDFALNEVKLAVQDGDNVDSNFIHTSRFVLLDRQRVVRGYYDGLDSTALSRLARDLIYVALEKNRDKKRNLLRGE